MKFDTLLAQLFGADAAATDRTLHTQHVRQHDRHGWLAVSGKLPESRHLTLARRFMPQHEPAASYEALQTHDRHLARDGIEHLPDLPFGPEAMQRSQAICRRRALQRHKL